jgi:hypothetical protein
LNFYFIKYEKKEQNKKLKAAAAAAAAANNRKKLCIRRVGKQYKNEPNNQTIPFHWEYVLQWFEMTCRWNEAKIDAFPDPVVWWVCVCLFVTVTTSQKS